MPAQKLHVNSLKSTMVDIFTPQKSENLANKDFHRYYIVLIFIGTPLYTISLAKNFFLQSSYSIIAMKEH